MFSHKAFERVPAQPGPSVGGEEWVAVSTGPFPEPCLQHLDGFPPQRCTALLPSLALAPNVGSGSGHNIAAAKVDDLRCPQSCLKRDDEDRLVATPDPGGRIRRG